MALSSPSPEIKQLRVACVRAALSPLWTISGPAGTQGAPRSCERLDAPAYDSARGGAALEDTGGRPRRQADWVLLCGGAVHHAGARCVASVCFCTAENCWAQSSTVSPNSQAWETRASRKLTLSTRSSQQGRAIDGSWTTMWTSPSRGTALRLSPPVGRGQSLSAVPASTSGWYYPRAFNALAWCARRIALACSAEAAWPAAL